MLTNQIQTPGSLRELVQSINIQVSSSSQYSRFQNMYRNDRIAYVYDVMGVIGKSLTFYQEEILGYFDSGITRVAVRGPHGLGKTFLAAILTHHSVLTAESDAKTITTASAWRQLEKYLWPEIHKTAKYIRWDVVGRSPYNPLKELLGTSIKLQARTVEAFAVASDDHNTIEGAHGRQLIYIFDEAKAIPRPTWNAAEGAFSNAKNSSADVQYDDDSDTSESGIHKDIESSILGSTPKNIIAIPDDNPYDDGLDYDDVITLNSTYDENTVETSFERNNDIQEYDVPVIERVARNASVRYPVSELYVDDDIASNSYSGVRGRESSREHSKSIVNLHEEDYVPPFPSVTDEQLRPHSDPSTPSRLLSAPHLASGTMDPAMGTHGTNGPNGAHVRSHIGNGSHEHRDASTLNALEASHERSHASSDSNHSDLHVLSTYEPSYVDHSHTGIGVLHEHDGSHARIGVLHEHDEHGQSCEPSSALRAPRVYSEVRVPLTMVHTGRRGSRERIVANMGVTERAFALAISTPGDPSGQFYDIHMKKPGYEDWKVRHVTVEEAIAAGRISRQWVDQRKRQWGETSALFQNRVLGEFADSSEEGIVPLSWVRAANERWKTWRARGAHEILDTRRALGVDVARSGDDKTVFADTMYPHVVELWEFSKVSTTTTAGNIKRLARGREIHIEMDGGLGASVYDICKQNGVPSLKPITVSAPTQWRDRSKELRFLNVRAAMWWNVRELLDPQYGSEMMLPPVEKLTLDLTAPKWEIMANATIRLESKDSIRTRLGRSTDYGDAVCLSLWRASSGGGIVF